MLNKNVADYTNFDGKTNKKIVQAPGGASSFSIGWSNQKTDYGPERVLKKKNNYEYNDAPQYPNHAQYQNKQTFNYNEPIKVMQQKNHYQMRSQQLGYPPKQETYNPNLQAQSNKKYGGQYGYNNYTPQVQIPQNQRSKQQQEYQDSLDAKLSQHGKTKNSFSKPPQPPQNNSQRPCVKIHEQKSNVVLGDNNYNYWKQANEGRKSSNQSNKRPNMYEAPLSAEKQRQVQQPAQKTSVKVHNPPGGRSNFTFG